MTGGRRKGRLTHCWGAYTSKQEGALVALKRARAVAIEHDVKADGASSGGMMRMLGWVAAGADGVHRAAGVSSHRLR